jgi:hypothetical protein
LLSADGLVAGAPILLPEQPHKRLVGHEDSPSEAVEARLDRPIPPSESSEPAGTPKTSEAPEAQRETGLLFALNTAASDWVGTTSGDVEWNDPSNWDGGVPDLYSDAVVIETGGDQPLRFTDTDAIETPRDGLSSDVPLIFTGSVTVGGNISAPEIHFESGSTLEFDLEFGSPSVTFTGDVQFQGEWNNEWDSYQWNVEGNMDASNAGLTLRFPDQNDSIDTLVSSLHVSGDLNLTDAELRATPERPRSDTPFPSPAVGDAKITASGTVTGTPDFTAPTDATFRDPVTFQERDVSIERIERSDGFALRLTLDGVPNAFYTGNGSSDILDPANWRDGVIPQDGAAIFVEAGHGEVNFAPEDHTSLRLTHFESKSDIRFDNVDLTFEAGVRISQFTTGPNVSFTVETTSGLEVLTESTFAGSELLVNGLLTDGSRNQGLLNLNHGADLSFRGPDAKGGLNTNLWIGQGSRVSWDSAAASNAVDTGSGPARGPIATFNLRGGTLDLDSFTEAPSRFIGGVASVEAFQGLYLNGWGTLRGPSFTFEERIVPVTAGKTLQIVGNVVVDQNRIYDTTLSTLTGTEGPGLLHVQGTVELTQDLEVRYDGSEPPVFAGETYRLLTATGGITGGSPQVTLSGSGFDPFEIIDLNEADAVSGVIVRSAATNHVFLGTSGDDLQDTTNWSNGVAPQTTGTNTGTFIIPDRLANQTLTLGTGDFTFEHLVNGETLTLTGQITITDTLTNRGTLIVDRTDTGPALSLETSARFEQLGIVRINEGTLALGSGALTLYEHGLVEIKENGTLTADGAQLDLAGTIDLAGGTLELRGAGDTLILTESAELTGYGTVAAPVENHGTLRPASGTLEIEGDLTQTNTGTLVQRLDGGTVSGLGVTGDVAAAGLVSIELAPGETPTDGDQITLLTFSGALSGTFGSPTIPELPAGLTGSLISDAGAIALRFTASTSFDLDEQVTTGLADLSTFLDELIAFFDLDSIDLASQGQGDPELPLLPLKLAALFALRTRLTNNDFGDFSGNESKGELIDALEAAGFTVTAITGGYSDGNRSLPATTSGDLLAFDWSQPLATDLGAASGFAGDDLTGIANLLPGLTAANAVDLNGTPNWLGTVRTDLHLTLGENGLRLEDGSALQLEARTDAATQVTGTTDLAGTTGVSLSGTTEADLTIALTLNPNQAGTLVTDLTGNSLAGALIPVITGSVDTQLDFRLAGMDFEYGQLLTLSRSAPQALTTTTAADDTLSGEADLPSLPRVDLFSGTLDAGTWTLSSSSLFNVVVGGSSDASRSLELPEFSFELTLTATGLTGTADLTGSLSGFGSDVPLTFTLTTDSLRLEGNQAQDELIISDQVGTALTLDDVAASLSLTGAPTDPGLSGGVTYTAGGVTLGASGHTFVSVKDGPDGDDRVAVLTRSYSSGRITGTLDAIAFEVPNRIEGRLLDVQVDLNPFNTNDSATFGRADAGEIRVLALEDAQGDPPTVTLPGGDLTRNGVFVDDMTRALGDLTIPGILTLQDATLSLSNLAFSPDYTDSLLGAIDLSAETVPILPGNGLLDTAAEGVSGTFDLRSATYTLTLDRFTATAADRFAAEASSAQLTYDILGSTNQDVITADTVELTLHGLAGLPGDSITVTGDGLTLSPDRLSLTDFRAATSTDFGFSFLELPSISVAVSGLVADIDQGQIAGTVALEATSGQLFPGISDILAWNLNDGGDQFDSVAARATLELGSSAYTIEVDQSILDIGGILKVFSNNLTLSYDPTGPAIQELLRVGSVNADLVLPLTTTSVTLNDLVVTTNGLTLGETDLDLDTIDFGESIGRTFLQTNQIASASLRDVSVTYNGGVDADLSGELTFNADSAGFFPQLLNTIGVEADVGLDGRLDFKTGAYRLDLTGLGFALGDTLELAVGDITLNFDPTATTDQLLASIDGVDLTIAPLGQTLTLDGFTIYSDSFVLPNRTIEDLGASTLIHQDGTRLATLPTLTLEITGLGMEYSGGVQLVGSLTATADGDLSVLPDTDIGDVLTVDAETLRLALDWTGDTDRLLPAVEIERLAIGRPDYLEFELTDTVLELGAATFLSVGSTRGTVPALDLGATLTDLELTTGGDVRLGGFNVDTPDLGMIVGELLPFEVDHIEVIFGGDSNRNGEIDPGETFELGAFEFAVEGTFDLSGFADLAGEVGLDIGGNAITSGSQPFSFEVKLENGLAIPRDLGPIGVSFSDYEIAGRLIVDGSIEIGAYQDYVFNPRVEGSLTVNEVERSDTFRFGTASADVLGNFDTDDLRFGLLTTFRFSDLQISPLIQGKDVELEMSLGLRLNPETKVPNLGLTVDRFAAGSVNIEVGSALRFEATELTFDFFAHGNEPLFAVETGALRIPGFNLAGNLNDFTVLGDFTIKPGPKFKAEIVPDDETLGQIQWPTYIPIQIDTLVLSWDDFEQNPEGFELILSATADAESFPGSNLTLAGSVSNVRIDGERLLNGEMPITDLGTIGLRVGGDIGGNRVQGSFLIGSLRIDADGNVIPDADTTTEVDERLLFGAVNAELFIAGRGGFEIFLGISQYGPLQGYVSANFPIPVGGKTGFVLSGLRAGVVFNNASPDIDSALELRTTPQFIPAADLTFTQWETLLLDALANQAKNAASDNPVFNLLTAPFRIEGGLTLSHIATGEDLFALDGDFILDSTGKLLIKGGLDLVKIPGSPKNETRVGATLFFDLSEITEGQVQYLGLYRINSGVADAGVTFYGNSRLEFGETFDPENPPATPFETFRLTVEGGATLGTTTFDFVDLSGTITIEVAANTPELRLDFVGSLSAVVIGDISGAQGSIEFSFDANDELQSFGAFRFEANTLDRIISTGIVPKGTVFFAFNSSDTANTVTLNVPGQDEEVVDLAPNSSRFMIQNSVFVGLSDTGFAAEDTLYLARDANFGGPADQWRDRLLVYGSSQMVLGPADDPIAQFTARIAGVLNVNAQFNPGFALYAEISGGLDIPGVDIAANGELVLRANTTQRVVGIDPAEGVVIEVPSRLPAFFGGERLVIPYNPPGFGFGPYAELQGQSRVDIFNLVEHEGQLRILFAQDGMDWVFDGTTRLSNGNEVLFELSGQGAIAVRDDGAYGALKLQFANQSARSILEDLGFSFEQDVSFQLRLNSTAQAQDLQQIKGAPPEIDTVAAGPFVEIETTGVAQIAGLSQDGTFRFRFTDNDTVEVNVDGLVELGLPGGGFPFAKIKASGTLFIEPTGFYGRLTAAPDVLNSRVGIAFDGVWSVAVNTTETERTFNTTETEQYKVPAFAGALVVVDGSLGLSVGGGDTLDPNTPFLIEGRFELIATPAGVEVGIDGRVPVIVEGETLTSLPLETSLTLTGFDVAESFVLDLSPEELGLDRLGFTGDSQVAFQINTTGEAHPDKGLDGGVYTRVAVDGALGFGNTTFEGDFTLDASVDNLTLNYDISGQIRGGGVTVANYLGRGFLDVQLNGISGLLNLDFDGAPNLPGVDSDLELKAFINTTLTERTFSYEVKSWDFERTLEAGSSHLEAGGYLTIAGLFFEGRFIFEQSPQNLRLAFDSDLDLLTLGSSYGFDVAGGMNLGSAGLFGLFTVTQRGDLELAGLSRTSDAQLAVNTTGAAQQIAGETLRAGNFAEIRFAGRLDAGGQSLTSDFVLYRANDQLRISLDTDLELGYDAPNGDRVELLELGVSGALIVDPIGRPYGLFEPTVRTPIDELFSRLDALGVGVQEPTLDFSVHINNTDSSQTINGVELEAGEYIRTEFEAAIQMGGLVVDAIHRFQAGSKGVEWQAVGDLAGYLTDLQGNPIQKLFESQTTSIFSLTADGVAGQLRLEEGLDLSGLANQGLSLASLNTAAEVTVNFTGQRQEVVFNGGFFTRSAVIEAGRYVKLASKAEITLFDGTIASRGDYEIFIGGEEARFVAQSDFALNLPTSDLLPDGNLLSAPLVDMELTIRENGAYGAIGFLNGLATNLDALGLPFTPDYSQENYFFINTTGQEQVLIDSPILDNDRVVLEADRKGGYVYGGRFDLGPLVMESSGAMIIEGDALVIEQQSSLELFGANQALDAAIAVNEDGIAYREAGDLLDVDFAGLTVDGDYLLQFNTDEVERIGVPGETLRLELNDIEFTAAGYAIRGDLFLSLEGDTVRFDVPENNPLRTTFLNQELIALTGFVDEDGDFDLSTTGDFDYGTDFLGLDGDYTFRVSNQVPEIVSIDFTGNAFFVESTRQVNGELVVDEDGFTFTFTVTEDVARNVRLGGEVAMSLENDVFGASLNDFELRLLGLTTVDVEGEAYTDGRFSFEGSSAVDFGVPSFAAVQGTLVASYDDTAGFAANMDGALVFAGFSADVDTTIKSTIYQNVPWAFETTFSGDGIGYTLSGGIEVQIYTDGNVSLGQVDGNPIELDVLDGTLKASADVFFFDSKKNYARFFGTSTLNLGLSDVASIQGRVELAIDGSTLSAKLAPGDVTVFGNTSSISADLTVTEDSLRVATFQRFNLLGLGAEATVEYTAQDGNLSVAFPGQGIRVFSPWYDGQLRGQINADGTYRFIADTRLDVGDRDIVGANGDLRLILAHDEARFVMDAAVYVLDDRILTVDDYGFGITESGVGLDVNDVGLTVVDNVLEIDGDLGLRLLPNGVTASGDLTGTAFGLSGTTDVDLVATTTEQSLAIDSRFAFSWSVDATRTVDLFIGSATFGFRAGASGVLSYDVDLDGSDLDASARAELTASGRVYYGSGSSGASIDEEVSLDTDSMSFTVDIGKSVTFSFKNGFNVYASNLAGSTVFLDVNGNNRQDPNEPATVASEDGTFDFGNSPTGTTRPGTLGGDPANPPTHPGLGTLVGFDVDRNGVLDPNEGQMYVEGGTRTDTGRLVLFRDDNRDGTLNPDEESVPVEPEQLTPLLNGVDTLVERVGAQALGVWILFDNNGDGRLSAEELARVAVERLNAEPVTEPLAIANTPQGLLSRVEGAQRVFFDLDDDGRFDPGEPYRTPDDTGFYDFGVPPRIPDLGRLAAFDTNDNGRIDRAEGVFVVRGGTDQNLQAENRVLLRASAANYGTGISQSISPLSTLKLALVEEGMAAPEADRLIAERFGLNLAEGIDLFNPRTADADDPARNPTLSAANQIASVVLAGASLLGDADNPDYQASVYRALASALRTADPSEPVVTPQRIAALLDEAAHEQGQALPEAAREATATAIANVAEASRTLAEGQQRGEALDASLAQIKGVVQQELTSALEGLKNGTQEAHQVIEDFSGTNLDQKIDGIATTSTVGVAPVQVAGINSVVLRPGETGDAIDVAGAFRTTGDALQFEVTLTEGSKLLEATLSEDGQLTLQALKHAGHATVTVTARNAEGSASVTFDATIRPELTVRAAEVPGARAYTVELTTPLANELVIGYSAPQLAAQPGISGNATQGLLTLTPGDPKGLIVLPEADGYLGLTIDLLTPTDPLPLFLQNQWQGPTSGEVRWDDPDNWSGPAPAPDHALLHEIYLQATDLAFTDSAITLPTGTHQITGNLELTTDGATLNLESGTTTLTNTRGLTLEGTLKVPEGASLHLTEGSYTFERWVHAGEATLMETVTITDELLNQGAITVDHPEGGTTLALTDQARLEQTGSLRVTNGIVDLGQGSLELAEDAELQLIGNTGVFRNPNDQSLLVGQGNLEIAGHLGLNGGEVRLGSSDRLTIQETGRLTGAGLLRLGTLENQGVVRTEGFGFRLLGDFEQTPDGSLFMGFDRYVSPFLVYGDFHADGRLTLEVDSGFTGNTPMSLTPIYYLGDLTGTFATVSVLDAQEQEQEAKLDTEAPMRLILNLS